MSIRERTVEIALPNALGFGRRQVIGFLTRKP